VAAAEASSDQLAHFPVRWGPRVVLVAFNRIVMLTGYADPAETFVTCPDQDVVYGAGYCALDTGPIIFQVPDFGGRLRVYCRYDGRTGEFCQIGRRYGTGPGVQPAGWPDWSGESPAVSRRWSARPRRRCSRPRVCF
jgi:hypothetical protein